MEKKEKEETSGAENIKHDVLGTVFRLFDVFQALLGFHTDWLVEGRIILDGEGQAAPGSNLQDSPGNAGYRERRLKRLKK